VLAAPATLLMRAAALSMSVPLSVPPPRERRSLWSTVRDASAAPPTINDVVMLGKSKPREFSLGGKQGNIVIASSDSRVHKGWRLVNIDGQEIGLVGEATILTMLSQAARKGKHKLSFAGEKPTGGGGLAVAPMVRRAVAASGSLRVSTPHDAEREVEAERHRAAVEEAKHAARERRQADELAKQAEEAQRAERRERALAAGQRKGEEEREAREAREAGERGREEARRLTERQAARPTPPVGARAAERPRRTERGSAADDAFHSLPSRTAVSNPQQTLLLALTSPAAVAAAEAAAAAATKVGPCDKCDGDHHADVCPHFRKGRDKHKDAWTQYGKGGEGGEGGQGAVVVRNARVVRQPGDGACLFHSLAHGVGSSAAQLREQLASFVEESPDAEIAGTPLRDWVLWECGLAPSQYARRMRGAGQWGGAIELAIFSHAHKAAVCVYEPDPAGGHRRISVFGSLSSPKALHLLYGGRVHYDALVLPPA